MKGLENFKLLIAGGGDVIEDLKTMAKEPDLQQKIIFRDKMPYDELMNFTASSVNRRHNAA